MHNPTYLVDSSTIEAPTIPRASTPGPEERLSHTFKSLFTLADVAARRRASRNIRNLNVKTDENRYYADDAADSSPLVNLRRSKSSGDVAVLGENTRALNAHTGCDTRGNQAAVVKVGKCTRGRALTTSSMTPSKIPKAKSPISPNTSLAGDCIPPVKTHGATTDIQGLNVVDNALFVMLTPPHTPTRKTTKNLTLAAHVPSLPKVASPFSPRTSEPWPRDQTRASTNTSPGTGHTNASLHLTKSHWELRYEAWVRSLRIHRRPRSARSVARPCSVLEESSPRSRFPEPPTNPALFPRAGMLTPKALRHYSIASDDESRSALELDWALRAWPMDKIHRTLFLHDMDVRVWFPVAPCPEKNDRAEIVHSDMGLEKIDNDEREVERSLRRWEWDWELRWRVVEGMVEDENDKDREECEYDVYLAGENCGDGEAYGGCEVGIEKEGQRTDEWEWSEDAMQIDAAL